MRMQDLQNGDVVYAAVTISNDGSVPEADPEQVFAEAGAMGMLINTGYFEEFPDQELYLVSFRNDEGELGPPVTCLAHELRLSPLVTN